jgi:hypothetical protein
VHKDDINLRGCRLLHRLDNLLNLTSLLLLYLLYLLSLLLLGIVRQWPS